MTARTIDGFIQAKLMNFTPPFRIKWVDRRDGRNGTDSENYKTEEEALDIVKKMRADTTSYSYTDTIVDSLGEVVEVFE